MSKPILREIDNLCRSAAINACWHQWSALGASVSSRSKRRLAAIIDPEALLLLTAAFQEEERRLTDVLSWWATVGSNLVNTQRSRSFLAQFPRDLQPRIAAFAQTAYESGDKRWQRLASVRGNKKTPSPSAQREKQTRRVKGPSEPSLEEPAVVLLRIRAGFGVSVKSDILAVLLGLHGSIVTVRRIAQALGYSKMAITVAAQAMAKSKLIEKTADRPAGYFVHLEPWAKVLKLDSFLEELPVGKPSLVPTWRFWPQLFEFLIRVSDWSRQQLAGELSTYVLSSQARDLYYSCEDAFFLNRIPVPEPAQYKGETYLEAFRLTLKQVSTWLDENL